jgi:hypothetical protein
MRYVLIIILLAESSNFAFCQQIKHQGSDSLSIENLINVCNKLEYYDDKYGLSNSNNDYNAIIKYDKILIQTLTRKNFLR